MRIWISLIPCGAYVDTAYSGWFCENSLIRFWHNLIFDQLTVRVMQWSALARITICHPARFLWCSHFTLICLWYGGELFLSLISTYSCTWSYFSNINEIFIFKSDSLKIITTKLSRRRDEWSLQNDTNIKCSYQELSFSLHKIIFIFL